MTSTTLLRRRALPLATAAAATLLAGLLVSFGPSGSADAGTTAVSATHTAAAATDGTFSKRVLHDKMRKLWEQHVAWTRMAIVDFAASSDGFDASAARLIQNQMDIGDAIKPFFGTKAGNALTALLKEHITTAVEVLQAAKSGDQAAFDDALARWYRNAKEIADFLSAANPTYWHRSMMRDMMKVHLDQTLAEASDQLQGEWADSVAEYDHIERHMLQMADDLSAGIIARFPKKFR